MSPSEKRFPIIKIADEYWIRITYESITLRAGKITKKKERVSERSGHRFDEAAAKGSIKIKSKEFLIDTFSDA